MYYYGVNGDEKVLVVKGREHPDPVKVLTWGRGLDGLVIPGDYNRYYTRAGKNIEVKISFKSDIAMNENVQIIDKLIKFIRTKIAPNPDKFFTRKIGDEYWE